MLNIYFVYIFVIVDESKKYLESYKLKDEYFFETDTCRKSERTLKKESIVILTGPTGCGKTITAIHLILKMMNDREINWTFRKIRSWKELSFMDNDENSLIFIDNIFHRYPMDHELKNWWTEFDRIYEKYFVRNEVQSRSVRVRIVLTARKNLIFRVISFMGKIPPILREDFLINASPLTDSEKIGIMNKQIHFAKQELNHPNLLNIDSELDNILIKSEGPIGFPLCAHLYVCGEGYQKSGVEFFTRPIVFLKLQIRHEIEEDKTNETKSLLFVLFFYEWSTKTGNFDKLDINNEMKCESFLNSISPCLLKHFGPFNFKELRRKAQKLSGTLLMELGGNNFRFIHDSVYEATGAYICETYVCETARYFPLNLIQTQNYENLSEKETSDIALRLLYEAISNNFADIFACKTFRNKKIAKYFCSELEQKSDDIIKNFFTVPSKGSPVNLPCMFWCNWNRLSYLTELLSDIIVKRKDIDPSYQLYVSLYGICARNEGLLNTIDRKLCAEFDVIKPYVLRYRDSKDNNILHFLISSEFSDKFAAVTLEKLVENGMSTNSKNNKKVTPVMVAVQQKLPRIEVIKSLKRSAKLQLKDVKGFNVFHHCLESDNDDEMCMQYLKILLQIRGSKDLLKADSVDGDTPLSIATKENKRSRIQSILTLLEKDNDIIETLNGEGLSPLHLTVRSLTGKSPDVELECCVRVILLIKYGASTINISDMRVEPTDECKYDHVKSILNHPEDETNMKESLERILGKLKSKQCIMQEEIITSSKISRDIRTLIEQAIHCLKNVSFVIGK